MDNDDVWFRFFFEVEVIGVFEYFGIVLVYGMGIYVNGWLYYVMWFVKGKSFKEVVDYYYKLRRCLIVIDF